MMKLNRKALAAALLLGLLLAPGCQKKENNQLPPPDTLAQTLVEDGSFTDQLDPVTQDTAMMVLGLDETQVQACSVYFGTGATAEQVAVIAAKDEKSAGAIASALQEYLKQQLADFKDYAPAEVPKLEDALVSTSGNTVVLCVSGDSQQAKKLLAAAMQPSA